MDHAQWTDLGACTWAKPRDCRTPHGVSGSDTGANRRLRLDHHERDSVYEQHHVRALVGSSGAHRVLDGDDVLVPFEVGEVDEANGDVLPILSEGHRPLAREPGGELLIRLDETVRADAQDDRAQSVEDILGTV